MMRICSFGYMIIVSLVLLSCKSKVEEADALRLNNEFDEAFVLYQDAASNGDAYAKWRLAEAYSHADGVDLDNEKALKLLKESSDAGCEEAICDMACSYLYGWYGQKKDIKKGKDMMTELMSKTHNSYVKSRYARELFNGWTFDENIEKALKVLKEVQDKNNPIYLRAMGEVYYYGTDKIAVDNRKAIDYYTKAFENGSRICAWNIGSIYMNGYKDTNEKNNIPRDTKKAVEWYEKGVEANDTQCMLAMCFVCMAEDSLVSEYHNIERGINLLKKAVHHGDSEAMWQLGYLYQSGEHTGKDDEKAFEYYHKSFDLQDSKGAFCLGLAYINGIGCEKDVNKGIEVWKKAVEFGDGGSANNLYCYYRFGNFANDKTIINNDLAKKYLKEGAKLGDGMACWNLGREYYYGKGLFERNEVQAFAYIKQAADKGIVDACALVAYMYKNAIGCNKDINAAKKYEDMTKAKENKSIK